MQGHSGMICQEGWDGAETPETWAAGDIASETGRVAEADAHGVEGSATGRSRWLRATDNWNKGLTLLRKVVAVAEPAVTTSFNAARSSAHSHLRAWEKGLEAAKQGAEGPHSEDHDAPSRDAGGAEQSAGGLKSALGRAQKGVAVARKITDFSIQASKTVTQFWVGVSRTVLESLPGGEEGEESSWLSEDLNALLNVLALAGKEFAGETQTPSSYWAIYRSLTALVKIQRAVTRAQQPLAAHLQARSAWLATNLDNVLRYFTYAEAAIEGTTAPLMAHLGRQAENCASQNDVVRQLTGCNAIAFSDWQSRIYCPCFFVAVDDTHKEVIVVFRGTMSFKDALTDLVCEPVQRRALPSVSESDLSAAVEEEAPGGKGGEDGPTMRAAVDVFPPPPARDTTEGSTDEGTPSGEEEVDPCFYYHGGMLMAAERWVKKYGRTLLDMLHEDCRGHRLIFVGHSLGAGMASLVAHILTQSAPFENIDLECYAFACPAVASLSVPFDRHIFPIVLQGDVVPTLSLRSAKNLSSQWSDLLLDIQELPVHIRDDPRVVEIATGFSTEETVQLYTIIHRLHGVEDRDTIEEINKVLQERTHMRESEDFSRRWGGSGGRAGNVADTLYVPGEVVNVVWLPDTRETSEVTTEGNDRDENLPHVRLCRPRDLGSMRLQSDMVSRHLPHAYRRALEALREWQAAGSGAAPDIE